MKKLSIIVLFMFLASMFNSCEDEETASLIGKWLWELGVMEYYIDDVFQGSESSTEGEWKYLEFFKGGTGTVWFDDVEYETFNWKKEGKTVTVDEGTVDEQTIKIEKLSESTLKFKLTMEEDDGGVIYKMVVTVTMSKVEE
jgi:hypothetical protein